MAARSLPSLTSFVLNVQYTLGYVAAGFLVSVPIQLLWVKDWADLFPSLIRGALLMAIYALLWPIVRFFDWSNMKLPEFKLFELQVTRNATLVCLFFLLLSLVDERVGSWRMMWLLFLLEGIAYLKIKAHTLIFREFYAIEQQQNEKEWFEELRDGLVQQASHVGDQLLRQAREVNGSLRLRARRVARRVGVAPRLAEPEEDDRLIDLLHVSPCCSSGPFGGLGPTWLDTGSTVSDESEDTGAERTGSEPGRYSFRELSGLNETQGEFSEQLPSWSGPLSAERNFSGQNSA